MDTLVHISPMESRRVKEVVHRLSGLWAGGAAQVAAGKEDVEWERFSEGQDGMD